jgi:flagellar assembly protein FliH
MPYDAAGERVIRAASDAERVTGLATLRTPALPATEWTDVNQLARTVLGEVAEEARAQAYEEGYAIGWARGRQDGRTAAATAAEQAEQQRQQSEARREAEHQAAITALRQAAQQVRGLLTELCTSIEEQGTELAWALTETLLGREISVVTDGDVVRRVLAVLPGSPTATVRLHPQVAGSVDAKELLDVGVVIVPDTALAPADAVVEAEGSVTDLRIGSAMERLREVLR